MQSSSFSGGLHMSAYVLKIGEACHHYSRYDATAVVGSQ